MKRVCRGYLAAVALTVTIVFNECRCEAALPEDNSPREAAARILAETGVKGGFVVHLGCGDGKLTAGLRANDSYTVQGLDADAANLAKARDHVRSLGLYGKVTVDHWRPGRLPYIDNLVNLLVSTEEQQVPREEILRVLAPNGVAYVSRDGTWSKTVKPWPAEIDQWTHYLHDAGNNAVAQDTVVGPPKHFQWIGDPRWLRHHDHMSGLSAMVSAKGRLFYIVDLGPRWSVQMPPQWTLIARDAFNGSLLWQRPIDPWHAHLWPLKKGPAQLMRRLVAEGDTVYVTLGVGKAVTALDAATGQEIHAYQDTQGAEEMILNDGILFVLVNPELDAYKSLPRESVDSIRGAGRDWNWDERQRRVTAFEATTGRRLWSKDSRVAPNTLAAAGKRLYFHDGDRVVCLDPQSGADVWVSQPIARWQPMHVLFGPTLVVHEDVVLFAGGENMDPLRGGNDTMTALACENGEVLWTAPHPQSGYASAEDLLVVDGLVWCGVTTNRRDSGVFTGRDLHTGEVVSEFPPDDWPHMPHHRCHRAKATSNYLLTSRTGIEFVDFRSQHWTAHHWVRGSCNYGIMPSNGLLYAPPHSCACYPLAKLNAFNALAPQRGQQPSDRVARLARGPAYDDPIDRQSPSVDDESLSWPTHRHDAARSGATKTVVPADVNQLWKTEIGGKLSGLVMADDKVFVAAIDRHTVHAIDAGGGNTIWSYTTGGRVDSPPTVWQGRVIFGSADGHVYCLRAADGAPIWRFQAAPVDQRLMAFEQVESVWPVHGSLLLREGIVYCVAGRSMWLDGGMRLLRLDARTGEKLSETVLDDKYPGSDDNLQRDVEWPNLPVALSDVLSCDGRHVYMRAQPFDLEGKRIDVFTPRDYTQQRGETAHLFCPTGFLDDSWWHRSYWLYGRSFIGGAGGWYLAAYQAPAGRILVVDGASVYGFGRAPLRVSGTPNTCHLFACDTQPEIINPNPKQPTRKQGTSVYGRVIPTRLDYHWSEAVPLLARAMVATNQKLFVAGPPVEADEIEVYGRYGEDEVQKRMAEHVAAFEGKRGALLMAVSKDDGSKLAAYRLKSAPVFDGMIAARGRLFMSTSDGHVMCLGSGDGQPLEPAPDVEPGPVTSTTPGFSETKSHPDFQHLEAIAISSSDLGYRMQTPAKEVGLALKQLATPFSKRAELSVKVRPTPGAAPDKPGNGFIVFGDKPEDAGLVKCGFRISGKRLFIVQGALVDAKSVSTPVDVKANEVAELRVVVDVEARKVTVTMHDASIEVTLDRPLETINWVGCCITSVTTDFAAIEISGE